MNLNFDECKTKPPDCTCAITLIDGILKSIHFEYHKKIVSCVDRLIKVTTLTPDTEFIHQSINPDVTIVTEICKMNSKIINIIPLLYSTPVNIIPIPAYSIRLIKIVICIQ